MNNREITVGEWIITSLIMIVPIVNIVMLFIWAFGGGDTPISKKNWAKATLICMLIGFVCGALFFGSAIALVFAAL